MLDDYGFEEFEENTFPIAYLITFRTYGTWLHGDKRCSVARGRGKMPSVKLEENSHLEAAMKEMLVGAPVQLTSDERKCVSDAMIEVCNHRSYGLRASNVQSNHVHAVVSKAIKPEKIVNDFKVYSTRKLRTELSWDPNIKIWSRGASTKYLWKPRQVAAAVEYVLYAQGDVPMNTVFELEDDV